MIPSQGLPKFIAKIRFTAGERRNLGFGARSEDNVWNVLIELERKLFCEKISKYFSLKLMVVDLKNTTK